MRTSAQIGRNRTLIRPGIVNEALNPNTLVRGVVIATYTSDINPFSDTAGANPTTLFCDVVAYSQRDLGSTFLVKRALVSCLRGGLHEGRGWTPRAASFDFARGLTLTPSLISEGFDPANVDGDHVLVGFIDGQQDLPVILCGIPHPSADVGKEALKSGTEEAFDDSTESFLSKTRPNGTSLIQQASAFGSYDINKHRGTLYGVTERGDFFVDATAAHNGQYNPDGSEPTDQDSGDIKLVTAAGGNVSIEAPGGTLGIDDIGQVSVTGGAETTGAITISPDGSITLKRDAEQEMILEASGDMVIRRTFPDDPSKQDVEVRLSGDNVSVTGLAMDMHINGNTSQSLVRGDALLSFLQGFVATFNSHTHAISPGTVVVAPTPPPGTIPAYSNPAPVVAPSTLQQATTPSSTLLNPDIKIP